MSPNPQSLEPNRTKVLHGSALVAAMDDVSMDVSNDQNGLDCCSMSGIMDGDADTAASDCTCVPTQSTAFDQDHLSNTCVVKLLKSKVKS